MLNLIHVTSLIQDWVDYWDSLVLAHKDPTSDVIGSSLTQRSSSPQAWQIHVTELCGFLYTQQKVYHGISAVKKEEKKNPNPAVQHTSAVGVHSFRNVRCALKNTASKGKKTDINVNDSFKTLMCHSQLSPFSKTNKSLAFHIFLKFRQSYSRHVSLGISGNFFLQDSSGLNSIVNTLQGIRNRISACSVLARKGLTDIKALLNSLRLQCFGEVFVNLTQ